jgi:hypothetical protein
VIPLQNKKTSFHNSSRKILERNNADGLKKYYFTQSGFSISKTIKPFISIFS